MKRILQAFTLTGLILIALAVSFVGCKKEKSNSAPVIASVMVNPSSVPSGGTATITVTATDADGDALTYTYLPTGGAISGTGASVNWTVPTTGGAYSVAVTVTDGKGGTATGTGSVTVQQASTNAVIAGTASFPAGVSGDLSNAKVSIYTTWENWNFNQPIKFTGAQGSGASVSFNMTEVLPGNYYMDIWKDIDNSGTWTSGDFVGWYGSGGLGSPNLTEFQVISGQTFNVNISMYIIAKGDKLPK